MYHSGICFLLIDTVVHVLEEIILVRKRLYRLLRYHSTLLLRSVTVGMVSRGRIGDGSEFMNTGTPSSVLGDVTWSTHSWFSFPSFLLILHLRLPFQREISSHHKWCRTTCLLRDTAFISPHRASLIPFSQIHPYPVVLTPPNIK